MRKALPVGSTSTLACISILLLIAAPGFSTGQQQASTQAVLDGLVGLEFREFVDESYKQVLLRSPETVTWLGLSGDLGIRDDQLDNICYSFLEGTYELKAGIYDLLLTYDRSSLTYDQQISYDSYKWVLEGWALEHEYMYHFYPVTHRFSQQLALFRFFDDDHPMETLDNANDYISRLEQVDDQMACLISNIDESEARGIIAPALMLQRAADQVRGIVPGGARYLSFYTTFDTKSRRIPGLTELQRQAMVRRAENAINTSVIPGYRALVARLDQQVPIAPPANGVWQLPEGDDFYEARLRHHTTTDLTPTEIHELGLVEVARIQAEIRDAFNDLGYPSDISFPDGFNRVAVDSGIIPANEIVALNEGYIRQAQEDVREVFDIEPQTEVVVRGGAGGGFYVAGPLDGSRPGAYYIGNQADSPRYWMRTIAYHEAVPGHHFQIAIGNELDVPLFMKSGGFYTAYVEGWALYAELLAKELGWYDDDPYSEIGRLQWELLRAARLVVDTGLHYYRWSRQDGIDYLVDEVGRTPAASEGSVDRYLDYVAQATAYKIGELEILNLRQRALDELGQRFDIKDFHRAMLSHHRLPLPLLERVINDYIASEKPIQLRAPGRVIGRRAGRN